MKLFPILAAVVTAACADAAPPPPPPPSPAGPVGRPEILAKAGYCGLDPARDLAWAAGDRALVQDRGAPLRDPKCLVDWAARVDAPVDLPPSKS